MPFLLLNNWKLFAIVAAVIAVFLAGWTANGWRLNAKISDMETTWANAATAASEAARVKEATLTAAIAEIDAKYTAQRKLNDAQINRLRAAVDAGAIRLRVRATCPGSMPGASPGSSVDHGAGAVLDADARQDYFTLREGLTRIETKLSACQGVLIKEHSTSQ